MGAQRAWWAVSGSKKNPKRQPKGAVPMEIDSISEGPEPGRRAGSQETRVVSARPFATFRTGGAQTRLCFVGGLCCWLVLAGVGIRVLCLGPSPHGKRKNRSRKC